MRTDNDPIFTSSKNYLSKMGVLLLQKRSGYYANHLGKIENAIKFVKTQILKNLKTKKKSIEYWYEDFDQILGKYYYLVHCVIRTIL